MTNRDSRPGRILARVALAAALVPGFARAQGETGSTTSSNVEASALRDDIHCEFEHLKAAGRLSGGLHGNDIRTVVEKHLPAGSSLHQAEAVLRQAGFQISHGHASTSGGAAPPSGIHASSRTIVKSRSFGTSNEVVVELGSDGTAGDPKVSLVVAHIYVTSL